MWTGSAFDGEAADAMAKEARHFLPLGRELTFLTAGGVGFHGALFLPKLPSPARPPPLPPRAALATPSVFKTELPIPEFDYWAGARLARHKARAAKRERVRVEVEEGLRRKDFEAARAYAEKARVRVPAPEVPPAIALLHPELEAVELRVLAVDGLWAGREAPVCARCKAVVEGGNLTG
jgi:hypothetical protein